MLDKKPRNKEGQAHGYWEIYHKNGKLHWKVKYINSKMFGKRESYHADGRLYFIDNFINGELHGYDLFYWSGSGLIDKSYYAR